MVDWSSIGQNVAKALPAIATVGSIVGGVATSRGGGTSVYKTNKIATHQMELNKQYTQWLNENGYSQMRKGLETAGYNPILATGATPQQGTMSAPMATESTTARSVNLNDIVGLTNTQASTDNIKANTNATNLGIIGKFLGNLGQINSQARKYGFYDSIINIRNGAINTAKNIFKDIRSQVNNQSTVLKGYISNSSRSFDDYEPYYMNQSESNAYGKNYRYNSPVPSTSITY